MIIGMKATKQQFCMLKFSMLYKVAGSLMQGDSNESYSPVLSFSDVSTEMKYFFLPFVDKKPNSVRSKCNIL